jgi:apolipoprotein N-acyltransferase
VRDDSRLRKAVFDTYETISLAAAADRPDLIIWPSSSVPGTIPAERAWVDLLGNLARRTGAWLLVGSSGFDKLDPKQRREGRVANSAFLISPEGRIAGRYDKMRLLPFDEYLPLRGILRWPSWIADPRMTDSRPGEQLTVFQVGERHFGALICWENYFPEQSRDLRGRGADFLVSMTNEGFTAEPAAHRQMFAMNVLRAVESGFPVVRTASTGISAIIAPSGWVTGRVQGADGRDTGLAGHLTLALPGARGRTFYHRHGEWLVGVAAVLLAAAAGSALTRREGTGG